MTPVPELEQLATMLAARIRDDDPRDNATWLAARLPDPGDWFRLAFVLAAAVPDDRTWNELIAWVNQPLKPAAAADDPEMFTTATPQPAQPAQPCGTIAAVRRHQRHKERLCPACVETSRAYERAKSARRRARQVGHHAALTGGRRIA